MKAAIKNGVAPGRPRRSFAAARTSRESRVHLGPVCDQAANELQAVQIARAERRRVAVVAVAQVRLADPSHDVQRCVTGALIIGIGAGFDQHDRQIEVAVFNCQHQRASAGGGIFARRAFVACMVSFTSMPAFNSALTTSALPSRMAKNSGV